MKKAVKISVDGTLTTKAVRTFGEFWDWAKADFDGAMLEVVPCKWDGIDCIALVDEEGLLKELEVNLIATAARQLRYGYVFPTPIVGDVIIFDEEIYNGTE